MKFKIGDKVRCIKKPELDHFQLKDKYNFIGKLYIVNGYLNEGSIIKLKGEEGCFSFELFRLSERNEIDHLDSIQQNFKDGI